MISDPRNQEPDSDDELEVQNADNRITRDIGPENLDNQLMMSADEKALNHLQASISKLDPDHNEVDAKIVARVTANLSRSILKPDDRGRVTHLSAQVVR